MNRTNIENGIQRLYYVFWTCVVIGGVVGAAAWWVDGGRNLRLNDVAAWTFLVVILPPAIMYSVRWIYRGFMPKADA